jgi:hypothetical protein
LLSGEQCRPASVVLDQPDYARFKTKRVSHRYGLTLTAGAARRISPLATLRAD